jgi:hypothetical protein
VAKLGDKLTIKGTRFEVERLEEGGPGAPFMVVTTPERPGMELHRFFVPAEVWDAAVKADILQRELERRIQKSDEAAKALAQKVKAGDNLTVGGVQFKVDFVSKSEGPPHLIHVVDTGLERHYLFSMPVSMWEAAVRGAWFPTDEELKRLHDEYDGEEDERGWLAAAYIKGLEARVRELTFDLEGEQADAD